MPFKNIIFDLDGTLSNPSDGFFDCLHYAVNELGLNVDLKRNLDWIIGPPLEEVMAQLLDGYSETEISRAVKYFRTQYNQTGLFGNHLYHRIPEVLAEIASSGKTLFVGTSKPQDSADRVVDHFGIRDYFKGVYGRNLELKQYKKAYVLREILSSEDIEPENTIMIGDRSHDIVAARANGMKAVGVTYGFGSERELRDAGAYRLCDSPESLPDYT